MARKNHKKRDGEGLPYRLSGTAAPREESQPATGPATGPAPARWKIGLAAAMVLPAFLWAYWPTWKVITRAWADQADYSHGYFVIPVAIWFLWAKRDQFPGWTLKPAWPGAVLILLSIALRYLGGQFYIDAIDGWSIVLWAAGVVWLIGGWSWIRWSWPSLVFLLFMIPIPYRGERMLSLPLQTIATNLSCWVLQCFGQPAIAEGNTIWLHDLPLEVEQACSGLRIFIGIAALAFVYLVLVPRPLWERVVLGLCVLPIALVANSTRIVATGLLTQLSSSAALKAIEHDVLGWLMIPYAAGLFGLVLWYLDRLVHNVEVLPVRMIVGQAAD